MNEAKHTPGINAPKYEAIHSSTDPVEMLAYDLAVELEQADLDRNDYVTVNRAKLRAIAERVLSQNENGTAPSDAFARWVEQGPKLALAAGVYVGIKVYASEDAARKAGDIS